MTLLNYVTPAFTCRRGGLRWKYYRTGGTSSESASLMMLTRSSSPVVGYVHQQTTLTQMATGSQSDRVRENEMLIPHTWDGAVATCTTQNPVIEAELPYYENVRFSPAKQSDWTSAAGGFRAYHWLSTIWKANDTDAVAIHSFVSVGEDFNLGFFTGAPVAWRVPQESEPASQS